MVVINKHHDCNKPRGRSFIQIATMLEHLIPNSTPNLLDTILAKIKRLAGVSKRENYFQNKVLIDKYGSWVKVQVAFYDFIFLSAMETGQCLFNERAFAEGEAFYEDSVSYIEGKFATFGDAWEAFIESQQPEITGDDRAFKNRGDIQ